MLAIEGFFCILIHLKIKPIRLSLKGFFFVILICLYCKFQGYSRVLLWIIFIKYNLRKTLLACATYTPVCGQLPRHSNDTWRSIQPPNFTFVSDVWKVSASLTQWGDACATIHWGLASTTIYFSHFFSLSQPKFSRQPFKFSRTFI
jgi:hypothetical protein